MCDGFVIAERRKFRGEELTVPIYSAFAVYIGHGVHMLYDLGDKGFIFFFGVLLVEDAVLLVSKADAGEAI